jgi:MYXO-CTERM domain-containing protein
MKAPNDFHLVAIALWTAGLFACGAEGPDLGSQQAAIVGGSPDSAERSTVGIGRILHNGALICTGTLIGADAQPYVLTAAHCLKDPDTGIPWSPADSIVVEFLGEPFSARLLSPHPEEDAENYENDIGIIELHRMPTHVSPALLASGYPKTGFAVTVVGYGATENEPPGKVRHAAQTSIEQVRGSGYDLVPPSATQGATGAFCGGDSGGPTFTKIWGPETLIGVHSAIKTTSFDVASDGSSPSSSDTELCSSRRTFDVAVANYLGGEWLESATGGYINQFNSAPLGDSPEAAAGGSPGDDVRAVVCGYTASPPPAAVLIALGLLGVATFARRRRRSTGRLPS